MPRLRSPHVCWPAAGMVSLLPTIDGRLFKIKGGNYQLAERLLNAVKAKLHIRSTVTRVHRLRHGRFELDVKRSTSGNDTEVGSWWLHLLHVSKESGLATESKCVTFCGWSGNVTSPEADGLG